MVIKIPKFLSSYEWVMRVRERDVQHERAIICRPSKIKDLLTSHIKNVFVIVDL